MDIFFARDVSYDSMGLWPFVADALHALATASDESDVGASIEQPSDEGESQPGGSAGNCNTQPCDGSVRHRASSVIDR
jgi:hypothetical protein